jgi:hypothetical protein
MFVMRPTWPATEFTRGTIPMMSNLSANNEISSFPVSPLTLSHQLLDLARQADRAGMPQSARSLLKLAQKVCVDRPRYVSA